MVVYGKKKSASTLTTTIDFFREKKEDLLEVAIPC
jgi:hypothetical protein